MWRRWLTATLILIFLASSAAAFGRRPGLVIAACLLAIPCGIWLWRAATWLLAVGIFLVAGFLVALLLPDEAIPKGMRKDVS